MKKKIFEYAIILHPTEDEVKAGQSSVLLVEPKCVLSTDVQGATLLAARVIPEAHLDKLDRIEVAVRPF